METEQLKRLLGQRLAVGFDGYEIPEDFRALVKEYKVGNVILFRRNCRDFHQLRTLCDQLRKLIVTETGEQPFIMLDEECGNVSRLAHISLPTPSAMAIGATGDPACAYAIGRMIGEELRSVGVNFNLAPVLDVNVNPQNPVIGIRSFGMTPELVSEMGCAYLKGLQSTGVFACGKHFPGHGDTSVDSHIGLPVIQKSEDEIRRVELVPFRAAIAAGVKGIMSAHCIFPAFEPEHKPATVSRRVMAGLLRDELGFDGLIISDGMEMQAVMDLYGIEDGVRQALDAGVDIALVCHSPKQAADTMEHCMRRYTGKADEAALTAHCARIKQAKKSLPAGPDGDESCFGNGAQKSLVQAVINRAVHVMNAPHGCPLPSLHEAICFGAKARRQSYASDALNLDAARYLAERRSLHLVEDPFSAADELMAAARAGQTIVAALTTNDDHLEERISLVNALASAGARMVAIAMTTPFLLDRLSDACWKICAYGYDTINLAALDALL